MRSHATAGLLYTTRHAPASGNCLLYCAVARADRLSEFTEPSMQSVMGHLVLDQDSLSVALSTISSGFPEDS